MHLIMKMHPNKEPTETPNMRKTHGTGLPLADMNSAPGTATVTTSSPTKINKLQAEMEKALIILHIGFPLLFYYYICWRHGNIH